MKITIKTEAGPVEVEAEAFQAAVGRTRFSFYVHNAHDSDDVVVTQRKSGHRVCVVDRKNIARQGRADAARDAVAALEREVGAEMLAAVLLRAESTIKATSASLLARFGMSRRPE